MLGREIRLLVVGCTGCGNSAKDKAKASVLLGWQKNIWRFVPSAWVMEFSLR